MRPSNGLLKPNKKLMRLTMPRVPHRKRGIALKISVVVMALACIITPIVQHYLIYWVNLSTHSSPEDPYFVINGFAETEDQYDPFIQDTRSSWESILAQLDIEYGLDAVHEWQGTYYEGDNDRNPQPSDLGSYHMNGIIYFDNEEDVREGLVSLGNHYMEEGYTTQLHETFIPYQKFYPETGLTDEENAQLEKDFVVEPIRWFHIWKGPDDMSLTSGTQAQARGIDYYDEAGAWVWAFMSDDNSIIVTYSAKAFPLATLPKFEGNAKLLDMHKLNPSFNMMDGTVTENGCPFKPSTFTFGGWNPKYGCLDD